MHNHSHGWTYMNGSGWLCTTLLCRDQPKKEIKKKKRKKKKKGEGEEA